MLFYISNTFINNTRLKLAKSQTKAKQQPKTELLLSENYLVYLSTLSSKFYHPNAIIHTV